LAICFSASLIWLTNLMNLVSYYDANKLKLQM
jgi:hypothetical protein